MGKAQKKRSMRRHNPVRVPDSHLPKGLASASASSSKTDAILPIIQKMESADSADRKWACVAVSNLIQNDPSTRRLLQGKNVVGALITRLTDGEEEVIIEACGALRNLCIDGGYEICAEMYNKNILTCLQSFVPKISSTLSQFLDSETSAAGNAQKLTFELADSVITILWCLSETSNKALNAINQMDLIPFLMSFLAAREKLPLSTVTAAAQCLYVLTDDNQPLIEHVRVNAAYISCLLSIVHSEPNAAVNGKAKATQAEEQSIMLRVLASGIVRNISPFPPPTPDSFLDLDKDIVLPLLRPIISSISLLETANMAQKLVEDPATDPQIEKLSLKDLPKSDHKTATEVDLDRLENQLRTVQLALEILIGVCATLPDPENNVLEGEGPIDADDDDDADYPDVEMVVDSSTSPSTTSATVFLSSLVEPLIALVHPNTLSFPPLNCQSPYPPITSVLSSIHVCALECLNNIFLSLATSPIAAVAADKSSGRKVWDEIWTALRAVGTVAGPGQERRQDMWEIAVGVLWGIGEVWKGCLAPNDEQINVLVQFCNSSPDPKIRVKCIGTLECLAQHPESIEGNRVIVEYLISILPTATNPSTLGTEPLLQALSALIDIYSDENMPYDINFRQGRILERLAESVDGVKKAVKAIDKRKEGGRELRRRGEEVRENLEAFIEYRRNLGF